MTKNWKWPYQLIKHFTETYTPGSLHIPYRLALLSRWFSKLKPVLVGPWILDSWRVTHHNSSISTALEGLVFYQCRSLEHRLQTTPLPVSLHHPRDSSPPTEDWGWQGQVVLPCSKQRWLAGKSPFSIGDTSSNVCLFPMVMVVFEECIPAVYGWTISRLSWFIGKYVHFSLKEE